MNPPPSMGRPETGVKWPGVGYIQKDRGTTRRSESALPAGPWPSSLTSISMNRESPCSSPQGEAYNEQRRCLGAGACGFAEYRLHCRDGGCPVHPEREAGTDG